MAYGILDDGMELVAHFAAPTVVSSNVPVSRFDALSLRALGRSSAAQRWEVASALIPLSAGGNGLLRSLVGSGLVGLVSIIAPQSYGSVSRRTGGGLPAVTGAADAGAQSVPLASLSGMVPAGTLVRFSGHEKVYITLADRDGPGDLQVFPPLRAAVASDQMTHRDDVVMVCRYDRETVLGMSYSDGVLMDNGRVTLVENVETEAAELVPLTATSTVYTVTVDTNGVRVPLPSVEALHLPATLETIETANADAVLASLVVTVDYVRHDQPLEDELETANADAVLASLVQTVDYVRHDQPLEDELETSNADVGTATLVQTVDYVRHDQPVEDHVETFNADVTGASLVDA